MSLFDETSEPPAPPRRRRPPPRGGRRPPPDRSLLIRRLVAAGALVVVAILIVVGVRGCLNSRSKQALQDYSTDAVGLIRQSDREVGRPLFDLLSSTSGKRPVDLQNQINQLRVVADEQLDRARNLDAPGDVAEAQRMLELTLQLRRDGVARIAQQLQPALSGKSSAVTAIALQMRTFAASEVIANQEFAPDVRRALRDKDLPAGSTVHSKFLPDRSWLQASTVASKLGAPATAGGKPAPGTHGHSLDGVSVPGTQLSTAGGNTIASSPPPTFAVQFTNSGENDESRVAVQVKVTPDAGGQPITASATVARTTAGSEASVNVRLKSAPAAGTAATVEVTVKPVPGETEPDNNTASYPVTFE